MAQYKLIIFDFDGTLAMTHPAIIFAMQKTFEHFNLQPPSSETITAIIGIPLEAAFLALYADFQVSETSTWVQTYRHYYRQYGDGHTQLFPGTKEILQLAQQAGIAQSILSNKHEQAVRSSVSSLQIHTFFDLVIGASEKIKSKPSPDAFFSLIQPAFPSLLPTEMLMVGDTMIDLQFAQGAGIDCCWADYGYGIRDEKSSLQPQHIISKLADLSQIIA